VAEGLIVSKEYPVPQAVGTEAEVVHAVAPVVVH